MKKIRNIKGTKDILPDETQFWQFIEKKMVGLLYGIKDLNILLEYDEN